MKKFLKWICIILGSIIAIVVLFFGYLWITEFNPDEIEEIIVSSEGKKINKNELRIVTLNVGYGGLDSSVDFFMDGGSQVNPRSRELVRANIEGIDEILTELEGDIYLLQEVDQDSSRSYHFDEDNDFLFDYDTRIFATNFSCDWVPYPLPMIGKVESGLEIISPYKAVAAKRIALPCPFSWPVRMANLKRCLAVSYFPIKGSDKQLVIVDLHLEAYDDGEGKIAQTKKLWEVLQKEYENGNYVIAGGDFNQLFPGAKEIYGVDEALWIPGELGENDIPEGWNYAYDVSSPTCRSLDKPYEGRIGHQVYAIDGFITSPNIEIKETKVHDYQFRYTDHNPVVLDVILK